MKFKVNSTKKHGRFAHGDTQIVSEAPRISIAVRSATERSMHSQQISKTRRCSEKGKPVFRRKAL